MEHLTTLDAGFLEAEDSDRHVSLAIGGLAVMEGPAPDHASLVSVLAERVSEIPRFTQVVHTHRSTLRRRNGSMTPVRSCPSRASNCVAAARR